MVYFFLFFSLHDGIAADYIIITFDLMDSAMRRGNGK